MEQIFSQSKAVEFNRQQTKETKDQNFEAVILHKRTQLFDDFGQI